MRLFGEQTEEQVVETATTTTNGDATGDGQHQSINGDRKRTRSSLDIKVDDPTRLTIPPAGQKQQQQQTMPRGVPPRGEEPLRASTGARRTRSGIPPRVKMEDLQDMSEDEMYRAIYEDPQTAAMYRAMLEREGLAEKELDGYPEHLQSMMKEGIPVKQWIILLVLLALGIYQLRKSLMGPSRSDKKKAAEKRVPKQKGKKGVAPTKTRSIPAKDKSETPTPLEEELVELLASETQAVPAKDSKKLLANRNSANKKKKVRPTKKTAKPETSATADETKPNADSVSTDDSSTADQTTEPEVEVRATSAQPPAPLLQTSVEEETVFEDNDGWKTVGKPTKAVANKESESTELESSVRKEPKLEEKVPEPKNGGGANGQAAKVQPATKPVKQTDTSQIGKAEEKKSEPLTPEVAPAPAAETAEQTAPVADKPVKEAAKSKSQKTKPKPKAESKPAKESKQATSEKDEALAKQLQQQESEKEATKPASIDNDEALAKELQRQEVAMAAETMPEPPAAEESWEEVTPKKGKKKA